MNQCHVLLVSVCALRGQLDQEKARGPEHHAVVFHPSVDKDSAMNTRKNNTVRASLCAASVVIAAATLTGSVTQLAAVGKPATPVTTSVAQAAAGTAGTARTVGTYEHDNTLTFDFGSGVKSLQLSNIGPLHLTPNQPFGGITDKTTKNTLSVTIKAGRHDSKGVATWFNSNLTTDATSNTMGYNDHSESIVRHPPELNFAFSATLTINGTAYPIVIGQGDGSFPENPWYVGGINWTKVPFQSWYSYGSAYTPTNPGAASPEYVVEQNGIIHHDYFKVLTA